MGGRSLNGGKNIGNRSQTNLLKTVQDFVTYNLNNGFRTSKVTNAEIIGDIDANGMANVKVSHEDHIRILLGYDPETGREEVEYDTEYHTSTLRIKVR